MIRKRVIAVALGAASLGGLVAGVAAVGGGGSSQAILKVPDYTKCVSTGKGGAVTNVILNASANNAVRHTACGIYYVAGV